MTTQYDFTLRFVLTPNSIDPDTLVDALFLAGCDDATLGTGYRGRLALNFSRESKTAEKAVLSACLLYTSPSPRDRQKSRMPSSA